jgi:hypothetical protein
VGSDDTLKLALARRDPALVERVVKEAAGGERPLHDVAEAFAREWPAFGHVSQYEAALPYYETVARVLCPLLERGDSNRIRCAQNLAIVLATIGRTEDAQRTRREVFEELRATRPPEDDERIRAAHEVAVTLRARGEHAAADALYAEVPICEHLRPVREELLRSGARIANAGYLWSTNSRICLWFGIVLDPEALQRRLSLDACVIRTENDDPRSGPELGLYCTAHQDGVVGPHPKFVSE